MSGARCVQQLLFAARQSHPPRHRHAPTPRERASERAHLLQLLACRAHSCNICKRSSWHLAAALGRTLLPAAGAESQSQRERERRGPAKSAKPNHTPLLAATAHTPGACARVQRLAHQVHQREKRNPQHQGRAQHAAKRADAKRSPQQPFSGSSSRHPPTRSLTARTPSRPCYAVCQTPPPAPAAW